MNPAEPLDVVRVAAEKGLVDEATVRMALGGRPPTLESLAHAVGLKPDDVAMILTAFQDRAGRQVKDDPSSSVRCMRCGDLFVRKGELLQCPGCGARIPLISPHEDTLLVEVADAERDTANHYGRFIRFRQIGKGAFGSVWLAWDPELGRQVALKIVSIQDDSAHEWFRREARIAAGLRHPNVVPVYDFGRKGAEAWMVMRYVEGRGLHEAEWTPDRAAAVMAVVADAVHAAHQAGIIHRDLKPHNILVDSEGRPYVADFGLARRLSGASGTLAATDAVIGTPAYMAPELVAGGTHADARSDVYGLGATLYHMLAGRPPYRGRNPLEVLHAVQKSQPDRVARLNPNVPRELGAVVERAMARNPLHRYATAAALAEDLTRFLEGTRTKAFLSRRYRVRRLQRVIATAGLAVTLLLAILVGVSVIPRPAPPGEPQPIPRVPPGSYRLLRADGDLVGYVTPAGKLVIGGDPQRDLSPRTAVTAAALEPGGKRVAIGHEDGAVILWDRGAAAALGPKKRAHESPVLLLAWSPTGEWLVSCDAKGKIVRWTGRGNSMEPERVQGAGREAALGGGFVGNRTFVHFRRGEPLSWWVFEPGKEPPMATTWEGVLDCAIDTRSGHVAAYRVETAEQGEPVHRLFLLRFPPESPEDFEELGGAVIEVSADDLVLLAVHPRGELVLLRRGTELLAWEPGLEGLRCLELTEPVAWVGFTGGGEDVVIEELGGKVRHQLPLRLLDRRAAEGPSRQDR